MFKSNKVNMILSLIMAVVLWMYVAGQVDPKTDKRIPDVKIHFLNIDNLQDNGLDFASTSDKWATVTVEGKRAQLNRIGAEDIKVTADLSNCTKGKNEITLKATTRKKAEIEKISPATISVIIDERVNHSKPVKVVFTGKNKKGKEPGNVRTYPENVNVYGASSIVDRVKYVQTKIPRSKIKGNNTTVTGKAVAVDRHGKKVNNVWLSSSTIEVTASMEATKEVDFKVDTKGSITGDKQLDSIHVPDKIKIKGPADTLDGISEVQGRSVDISGVKETVEIPVEVSLPYGVELAEENEEIMMKVSVKDLTSMTYDYQSSNIEITGLAKDMDATITETAISVTIKGTDEQIDNISKEDIICKIDLKGLDEGKHDVAIKASSEKEVDSITTTPETVKVEIGKE